MQPVQEHGGDSHSQRSHCASASPLRWVREEADEGGSTPGDVSGHLTGNSLSAQGEGFQNLKYRFFPHSIPQETGQGRRKQPPHRPLEMGASLSVSFTKVSLAIHPNLPHYK